MKLVPESDLKNEQTKELLNVARYETTPSLKQMSDLDEDISKILKSKLDEDSKAKLYSQSLRRFLTFKRQHTSESKDSFGKSKLSLIPVSTPGDEKKKKAKKTTKKSKRSIKNKTVRKRKPQRRIILPINIEDDDNNNGDWVEYV